MADLSVEVLPEFRRKGIGREALRLLLPFAKKHQRRLLLTFSSDRIPDTEFFLERLSGRRGLQTRINQLDVSGLDRDLVKRWLEQSEPMKSKFEVGLWDGKYPDDYIEAIAALFRDVANDSPRDNLDMEDMNFTPEIMRQMEQGMFARGDLRWTMYLIDRANTKLAGLTEIMWNPNRKMIVNQGFTGVYPQYRNKGLGRWLKAEMMNKILHEHPEVKFVRTTNANSNAPMLKINVEMGFKPYIANTIWQVETENVENYLSEVKQ
jgi:GNAT superfamily N-acetyltransferase